jgi:formamidopyrimidine-DNA glycosylase
MPELPEVETIARELRPLVLGSTIEGFWTDWPRAVKHPDAEAFATGVTGRRIEEVTRRAKWLVLELSGGWVIALQVKMTGQVFVLPAGTERDRHVHLVFQLDGDRELLVRDVRKFARVALYRRDEAGKALGADESDPFDQLGPEPLDPSFTLQRFRALIRGRRGRLKPLLVDQAFLAGVGNIYADEALWRAKLHPLRSASSLRPSDERALYNAIRDVLTEGIEHRGSSVDDYVAPESGPGEMQDRLDVYQRTGQPCHRCGHPIKRFVLGIRATHFCSWCQRLPKDEQGGGNATLLRTARSTSGRRGTRWSELPTGDGAVGARRAGTR